MNPTVKKVLIAGIIICAISALIYGGMWLHNYIIHAYNEAVADATQKIKAGVTEGVKEGVNDSAMGMLNPLGLIGKMFGR